MDRNLLAVPGNMNSISLDMLSSNDKWALQREGSAIAKDLILANLHENGRALLTKTALDNLGALSAFEAHLTEIAPYGTERYRKIVDAYAIGAACKIWRW